MQIEQLLQIALLYYNLKNLVDQDKCQYHTHVFSKRKYIILNMVKIYVNIFVLVFSDPQRSFIKLKKIILNKILKWPQVCMTYKINIAE